MADAEAYDMGAMRRKWLQKQSDPDPTADRKNKRKALANTVDGRSLRATGRTAQLNVRVRPDFRADLAKYSEQFGYSTLVEFIEDAVQAFVEKGGKNV